MATDGVKIIDGDTVHDIYNGIMDLYDSGASIETITQEFPFPQTDRYELDKLWKKINTVNAKPRKRKKYKTITSFLFSINDVLAFQIADNWYVTIVLDIDQYRGACTYKIGMYAGRWTPWEALPISMD